MDKFFKPDSVCVLGASNSPFNLGATICNLLKKYIAYTDRIYVVNSKGEDVNGCAGFAKVAQVPEIVDLAVIITPARAVPELVRDCGEAGIRNIVIESAGFAEEGEQGKAMQEDINNSVSKYGLRVMGPNCLGVFDAWSGFCCFYGVIESTYPAFKNMMDKRGTISYVVQSGGVGVQIMESLASDVVSLNKLVSIGNKSDIDESDMIEYFEKDNTEVICMYLENVERGRKLLETASRSRKPILIYKSGKSQEGARAAMSHTAGLSNDDRVFDSACRQSGIIRLKSIDELHSMPKILVKMPLMRGKRVAIFTNSGAYGGITSDLLTEEGLEVVRLSQKTQEQLKTVGRIFNVSNPVDLGPSMKETYLKIFEILLSAEEVDALLPVPNVWQVFVIEALDELYKMCVKYRKPAAIYTSNAVERTIEMRREYRLPLFESVEAAVRALKISHTHFLNLQKKGGGAAE